MRSRVKDILPVPVRRSLDKLGRDISAARRRRKLTIMMMAERLCISAETYRKVEQGAGTVALHVYAMTLFVLGLGTPLGNIIDITRDEFGLLSDTERLPQRVRPHTTNKDKVSI